MWSSRDRFLAPLHNPRWIPYISDYCDSWCSRCPFTERCASFAMRRHEARTNGDPFVQLAHTFADDVHRALPPAESGIVSTLAEAIARTRALSQTIDEKVHRAVSATEFDSGEEVPPDPVQNDANGSAKIACLAIEETLAAFEIIRQAAVIDAGTLRRLLDTLKQVGTELCERFPLAMGFVRPGFDEEVPGLVRPWSIDPAAEEAEEEEEDDE
jgi:hypothetical protein